MKIQRLVSFPNTNKFDKKEANNTNNNNDNNSIYNILFQKYPGIRSKTLSNKNYKIVGKIEEDIIWRKMFHLYR